MMSGRCTRKVSKVTPQLVVTCGLKLSTSTSNFGISRQNIALPRGWVTSSVTARLFKFTELYMPLVLMPCCRMSALYTAGGTGAPAPRHTSGRRTVSTCTTSAPSKASSSVQKVPAQACVKHSTRTPARGWVPWEDAAFGVGLVSTSPLCSPSAGAGRRSLHGVSESLAGAPVARVARPPACASTRKPRARNWALPWRSLMFCTTPEMQRRLARP